MTDLPDHLLTPTEYHACVEFGWCLPTPENYMRIVAGATQTEAELNHVPPHARSPGWLERMSSKPAHIYKRAVEKLHRNPSNTDMLSARLARNEPLPPIPDFTMGPDDSQLQRSTTLDFTVARETSSSPLEGPSQPKTNANYLGSSSARRILKRSQYCQRGFDEETVYNLHSEEATATTTNLTALASSPPTTVDAAAAAPFTAPAQNTTATTGYNVACYATHAEDARKLRAIEADEKEKLCLYKHINISRQMEGAHPLRLKPVLCKHAQDQADALCMEDRCSPSGPVYHNSVVIVMSPSGARVARLISPPRTGALACGELFYGGKYKRHLYDMTAEEEMGRHGIDCPCSYVMVFETMIDLAWGSIGVGKGADGRWVVEFAH